MNLLAPPLPAYYRPLIAISALVFGMVALLAHPASALEKQPWGDVVVDKPEDGVMTAYGNVVVQKPVEDDVRAGFGDVTVKDSVGGDVEAVNGDVRIQAPVGGSVRTGVGDVYVGSEVSEDVDVEHGDVYLLPGAKIGGDLSCANGTIHGLKAAPDAVGGDVRAGMSSERGGADEDRRVLGFIGWFFATLVFAAFGVLAAVLAPRSVAAAARRAEESPGRALLFGLLSVPVTAVLFVVLGVSVVGIPVLVLLLPLYPVLLVLGAVVVAFAVGRRILLTAGGYRSGNALAAVVGCVLVAATYLIPLLGGLVLCALVLAGTGAILLSLFNRRRSYAGHRGY